jgi:hypothetical protein
LLDSLVPEEQVGPKKWLCPHFEWGMSV